MDPDREVLNALTAAVTKSIFYICLTVAAALWFHSCDLSTEIIEQCRESCEGLGTYMKSVSSSECECAPVQETNNWVIPRK